MIAEFQISSAKKKEVGENQDRPVFQGILGRFSFLGSTSGKTDLGRRDACATAAGARRRRFARHSGAPRPRREGAVRVAAPFASCYP